MGHFSACLLYLECVLGCTTYINDSNWGLCVRVWDQEENVVKDWTISFT